MGYAAAWRLTLRANDFMSLSPQVSEDHRTFMLAKPIPKEWAAPPVSIFGRSKKLADFTKWMVSAVVISEKARRVLEPMIADHVQLLPFHRLRGKLYFAVNVLTALDNLLDDSKSRFNRFQDGRAWSVPTAVFRDDVVVPPVFKLRESSNVLSEIWVSSAFAALAIDSGLTGAQFLSPDTDPIKYSIDLGSADDFVGGSGRDA